MRDWSSDVCSSDLSRSISDGSAELVGGGSVPDGARSTFVAPTVLGHVRQGSELEQTEVFGPVLAALPFSDEDEAVRVANGTRYGLNATIFTRDIERAFQIGRASCRERVWQYV